MPVPLLDKIFDELGPTIQQLLGSISRASSNLIDRNNLNECHHVDDSTSDNDEGQDFLLDKVSVRLVHLCSMFGGILLMFYPNMVYHALQWFWQNVLRCIGRSRHRSKCLSGGNATTGVGPQRRTSQARHSYALEPMLDATDFSSTDYEDDENSLYVVKPSPPTAGDRLPNPQWVTSSFASSYENRPGVSTVTPRSEESSTTPTGHTTSAPKPKLSRNDSDATKKHVRNRSGGVDSRLDEPRRFSNMMPHLYQNYNSSGSWDGAFDDDDDNKNDDDITFCRSNSSLREVPSEESLPASETTETPEEEEEEDRKVSRKRYAGPISAAQLKSNLQQQCGNIPTRYQRCNAVSSSCLLQQKSSPPPRKAKHHHPSLSCSNAATFTGIGFSKQESFRNSNRGSSLPEDLQNHGDECDDDKSDPVIMFSSSSLSSFNKAPNNNEAQQKIHARGGTSLRSSLSSQEKRLRRQRQYHQQQQKLNLRRYSDSTSKHLAEDCRLLQRMMRSAHPEHYQSMTSLSPS